MTDSPLRVLIVDDSLVFRKILRDALATVPGVDVLGSANDGIAAIEKIERLRPDLITLDLEMPKLDGLGVLSEIEKRDWNTKAVMVSGLTQQGADTTMKAFKLGAFDFVVKPNGASPQENTMEIRRELQQRIDAFRATAKTASPPAPQRIPRFIPSRPLAQQTIDAVGLGISTGGPDALRKVIPAIPGDFPVPILIVQHMPPVFTKSLAKSLDGQSPLSVREAEEGEAVTTGSVLIAPGGKQMKVVREDDEVRVRLTDDPPENSCRPAVDYLFRSLVDVYGANLLGVIMTGMGQDGLIGCRAMKAAGASVVVQDEASCVVFGMPRFPIEENLADDVVPLDDLAKRIQHLAARRKCTV